MTGSGTVYRWLVEGDNVLGVDTVLGAVLLMTVALVGDAAWLRRTAVEHTPDPTPVGVVVEASATTGDVEGRQPPSRRREAVEA